MTKNLYVGRPNLRAFEWTATIHGFSVFPSFLMIKREIYYYTVLLGKYLSTKREGYY